MRYTPQWHEQVTLRDGRSVELRLVRPEDKPLFERGIRRLSLESRYRRFFSAKDGFTSAELRYLTELDVQDHVAIGAVGSDEAGVPLGLGVARMIRVSDEPAVGEAAIVVLDEVQGQGLGHALLAHLSRAARERGVVRLRGEMLAQNSAALRLVGEVTPRLHVTPSDEDPNLVVVEAEIPEERAGAVRGALHGALRLAAQGLLSLSRALEGIAAEIDRP